jgi:DNA invertase Pin-like site-specific DNA recombinase
MMPPQNRSSIPAINDAVDTLYGDNDFAPFRNLFNDFYAKDCSKKIRSVKKAQAERGERVGTRPPYGYKKDEINLKKIVPDPVAAEVVKHIFKLCAEGRVSRTAPQDIWIHYRDIGMLNDVKKEFDIPSMEEFYGMDEEMIFDDELPAAI